MELNPIRAGLIERAQDYAGSSAAAHCGLRGDPVLSSTFPPAGVIGDWSEWLHELRADEEDTYVSIRQRSHTGRPCGSQEFLDQIEKILDRRVRPKPRGPRKGTKYRTKSKDK